MHVVRIAGALALSLAFIPGAGAQGLVVPATEKKIDALLAQMTLEEKVGQLNQYSSAFDVTGPAPSAGAQKVMYDQVRQGLVGSVLNVTGAEATRKMQQLAVENSRLKIPMIFGLDVIHGYRTMFPTPLGEAASWDPAAIEQSARIAATEAAAAGLHWTFAPMVDIAWDARWGRIMEGAGEDPYLGAQAAAARVRGFQGKDLAALDTIAACAKHYAAYGFSEAGPRLQHRRPVGAPAAQRRPAAVQGRGRGGRRDVHELVQRDRRDPVDGERAPAARHPEGRVGLRGLRGLGLGLDRRDGPARLRGEPRARRAAGDHRRQRHGHGVAGLRRPPRRAGEGGEGGREARGRRRPARPAGEVRARPLRRPVPLLGRGAREAGDRQPGARRRPPATWRASRSSC